MKETRTVFGDLTVCADGSIGIRLFKQLVSVATGKIHSAEPHRVVVGWHQSPEEVMPDVVAHLDQLEYPISKTEVERVLRLANGARLLAVADPEIKATFDRLNAGGARVE